MTSPAPESRVAPVISTVPAQVLYLEDSDDEYARYAPVITTVMRRVGLQVSIERAVSLQDFSDKLKTRPHLAFCDNDLGKKGSKNAGLEAISNEKDKYPDVVFLLLTGQPIKTDAFGAKIPNPDHVLIKEYAGTKEYDDFIVGRVTDLLKRVPLAKLEYTFNLAKDGPRAKKANLKDTDLVSLVEQCLYEPSRSPYASGVDKVQLEVSPGGFSGSGVYLLHVWQGGKKLDVPGILKVSEKSRSIDEHSNYLRYVKWRLPYTWRVDILGTGLTEHFGAVCYSFAMGGGDEPAAINKFIRAGGSNAVDVVLRNILHSEKQTWYAERRDTQLDARNYFGEKPFYRSNSARQRQQNIFTDFLRDELGRAGVPVFMEDQGMSIGGHAFPYFGRAVFQNDWGLVRECVCHGDLNGNNLMFSGKGNAVVFIDFQDTGFHNLYRDFVSFESSVRLEFPDSDMSLSAGNWATFFEKEYALNQASFGGPAKLSGYATEVQKVREAAQKNFEGEAWRIYLVANLVHSLWLFEKALRWDKYKQLRLLGAILAGLKTADEFLVGTKP